jgi:hypothetical protein
MKPEEEAQADTGRKLQTLQNSRKRTQRQNVPSTTPAQRNNNLQAGRPNLPHKQYKLHLQHCPEVVEENGRIQENTAGRMSTQK